MAQLHRQSASPKRPEYLRDLCESGGDDQTKGAVLLQATQAIFTPQVTGFIPQESDSGGPAQVLEIFRSASSGKGP
jgi:hypothetical protein